MQIGPFVAVLHQRPSIKSEQILLEDSLKVKAEARLKDIAQKQERARIQFATTLLPATSSELSLSRYVASKSSNRQESDWLLLERRAKQRLQALNEKSVRTVPDLLPEPGRASYSRRVIRCLESAGRDLDGTHHDAQAAGGGSAQGALGNNTESRAVFYEALDEKTGEIQRLTRCDKRGELVTVSRDEFSSVNARAARFAAQTSAGKLLAATFDAKGKFVTGELTPRGTQWRVSGCTRRKVAAEVSILYSAKIKKAHFGGLMVCGSVWTCPPCAAKVSERRKNEVVAATDLHKSQGGGLYLVTLTAPHKRDHELATWLSRFSDARQRMRRQRAYRELLALVGHIGNIRSLEVTYGDANGWHPHEHALWLTEKPLTARKLEHLRSELFKLWRRSCVAAGLPPPNRVRGVDARPMESAAEYIAKFGREPKWGAGSEMAKQHIKSGKAKSMTPFDLLRLYHLGSDDGSHKRFGGLFVTFANAFFGKRQIVWSDGLKQLFGIEQKTDEEIAVEEAEDARLLIQITAEQWRVVLHQSSDVRQVLLSLAESDGYEAVRSYLVSLSDRSYLMKYPTE